MLTNLPVRLRAQAGNVENDGWLAAGHLMRAASDEITLVRVYLARVQIALDSNAEDTSARITELMKSLMDEIELRS
jgi:hypothetical protein